MQDSTFKMYNLSSLNKLNYINNYSKVIVNIYNCKIKFLNRLTLQLSRNFCNKTDRTTGSNELQLDCPHYLSTTNQQVLNIAIKDMIIYEDFISECEEDQMMKELEPYLKRMRYEGSHWDNAIHNYRETEKANWNTENKLIIDRIRSLAFTQDDRQLKHVHVLDITADGYIKPHIDSIKFCGDTITGLSLLSSSVMRLIHDKNKDWFVDIYLKRRSLYIMKGDARYLFTHEVLPNDQSYYKSIHIPRERRISVICRNAPLDAEV